ncbi:MAG: dihydroorotate dehydrogenase [Candidatus Altiarchaeales archaeon]|nr:dihydroorotate dehydrogenase [Candidatus Altiarchaeales archaeon]
MAAVSLSTSVSKLKLASPVILASGILDLNAGLMKRVASSGVGAITTKSIGLNARKGNPNPTIVEVYDGLLNSMGLCNPGIEEFKKELDELKGVKIPVIGSVYAGSPKEFSLVAGKMAECNVSAVELNVSCPNVSKGEKFGEAIGKNPKLVAEVVKAVKSKVRKLVIVKLTPNVSDIAEIALSAEKAGADALTAVNTFGPGMAINIDARKPVLGNKFGGLSGPAVKPLALACVYKISEKVKIPVIGCGGIASGRDVVEFLMAGAKAVEVGTAAYLKNIEVFNRINREIAGFMQKNKFKKIEDMVGLAHR